MKVQLFISDPVLQDFEFCVDQFCDVIPGHEAAGIDREESFLDRIVKDDNLKSLTGTDGNMLIGLGEVINKAKTTLIEYAEAFEKRHLPPYIEELLVLIGFPTRLIEEVINMRLQYASKMREPVAMMTDQLMLQFRSVLELAVKIKQEYIDIAEPQNGWDPPPCMDENFDQVTLNGLKYYFKLIGWRISSNKNTFKKKYALFTYLKCSATSMSPPLMYLKPNKLRLVASGSEGVLKNARNEFADITNHNLDIVLERRANLSRVNQELMKIKTPSDPLATRRSLLGFRSITGSAILICRTRPSQTKLSVGQMARTYEKLADEGYS